jgi:predicted nucleotidyltransferase
MARDLVLVHAFGLPAGRATKDIDFGIAVENWDQFQALKTRLVETGEFRAAPKEVHRLYWIDPGAQVTIPLDAIPFGGITSADQRIAWPPSAGFVMNVAGFEEALNSAMHLRAEDGFVIPVASIAGLAALKLIAWQDRRNENNKDATDLYCLVRCYADAGNLDRLYEQEMALLEATGFDLELAGAELLGRDTARNCQSEAQRQISVICTSERLFEQLILQMNRTGMGESAEVERITDLMKRFRRGFLGR